MNVVNCKKCGKMFNYITGQKVCPACKDALEAKFQEVRAYVRENKNQNVQAVAEACEVDPGQIRQWIREERLEFSEDSSIGINCEKCGITIRTGRFCEKCKASMAGNLNAAFAKPKMEKPIPVHDNKNKMRFL